MKTYGYCRISTKKQNIERQIRNIKAEYPDVIIVREIYTGTKTAGRDNWVKLLKKIQEGDTIIFDAVGRMSRDADEGFATYEELFYKGVELIFLKEPHINTSVYRKALERCIDMTGTNVDYILEGINKFLMSLAREQIKLAFEQAEKEVTDLHQRTREGIETARLNGKRIGLPKGSKIETKKAKKVKKDIYTYSQDFNGNLKDVAVIKIVGVSSNTYYKYKREIKEELGWTDSEVDVNGDQSE